MEGRLDESEDLPKFFWTKIKVEGATQERLLDRVRK